MVDTFLYALRAVLPILLIMALGAVTSRLGQWDRAFFKKLNGLCFHLFLPINLFWNVYTVEDLSGMNWPLIGFLVAGILAALALGVLAAGLLVPDRRQKGVVIQASFRANHAILGLPLAEALGGQAALGFASLSTAVAVPVFNLLAVVVLSYYGGVKRPGIRELLCRVGKNPLILGSVLGLVLVIIRTALGMEGPGLTRLPAVYSAVQMLSRIASPVMLFCLGAGLDFKAVGDLLPKITLGVVLRLILAPALVLILVVILRDPLRLTVAEMPAILAVCASPVAASSVVMTQELGGDDQLASQLVVWTSVCSMGTLFAIIWVLRSMGLL